MTVDLHRANRKNVFHYCFRSLFFLLILSNSPVFAQSTNNNPWVKIANGHLWVLSSDNVTYTPYFIKAVGYQPTPIGRYPSDWGYATTDLHKYTGMNNNIYDDPVILNRDFKLLQTMNANTIRIWSGAKSIVSCQCTNNGRDTGYITNAATTANTDKTQNTLDLAAKYGLKVIAGFWVNPLTFDASNNIGSIDDNGNPLTGQDIIKNFVNYVNTYKGNSAILFWAIGNENNYQLIGQGPVLLTTFESISSHGAAIYAWLQQNNYLDFDGNVLADVNSTAFQGALNAELISINDSTDYSTILNILITAHGTNLTPQQLSAWYALVNAMAKAAHLAEDPAYNTGGKNYHPVAIINGEIAEIGNSTDGAADFQLPDLDIWGVNAYRGQSFGTFFSDYAIKSQKPLWISEFGVDAFVTSNIPANIAGINDWTVTNPAIIAGQGQEDQTVQSSWDTALWNEIFANSNVTIGGSLMEYSDEWWKPYEFYCGNNSSSCDSTQNHFGSPYSVFPDHYMNQEWFGIMAISSNQTSSSPLQWGPDTMTPRLVYTNLQALWALPSTPTGLTATPLNAQVELVWNASPGAASYNVKRASVSGGPYTTIINWIYPTFADLPLNNGTTYYYVISAVNANGESSNSAQVSATPVLPLSPSIPTGLNATAGSGKVVLSWSASTGGATGYYVKRATTNGGPYTPIVGLGLTTLTDNKVTNGITYYYVVSAVNSSGNGSVESNNSAQVSATPIAPHSAPVQATPIDLPATPVGLKAIGGIARVTLFWKPVFRAASYKVMRLEKGSLFYTFCQIVPGPYLLDTSVVNGTTYFYKVEAVNASGQSAYSEPVSAKPTP
ncbi:MAG: hypothetical protein HQL12_02345 [Candidatus Omnitrophica bacterium]|nr:hypothetical protein [Candidatus Omnitrophota bacterium]